MFDEPLKIKIFFNLSGICLEWNINIFCYITTICEINIEVGIPRRKELYKAALIFFPCLFHTLKDKFGKDK